MKIRDVIKMLFLALLFGSEAPAWGPDGHYMVARLAVATLPPDMPAFFLAEMDQLMFLNYEPDAWRDPEEENRSPALRRGHDPDHRFHLEHFAPPVLPPDRYSFLDALCKAGKEPRVVGVLPYRAMELFQRLRVSFRQWRAAPDRKTALFLERRIIDDAGILGHYIADAAQPMHVTVNNNGWALPENPRNYSRDNTIHVRFEADFVHAHIRDSDVKPLIGGLRTVDDALQYIYAEIQRSHDQLHPLYELEKSTPFKSSTKADPSAVTFVASRLADAAATLRDLWYTAYRTSAAAR